MNLIIDQSVPTPYQGIIRNFIQKYQCELGSILIGKNITIIDSSIVMYEPFGVEEANGLIKGYFQEVKRIGFSDEEVYALIAHEIGHLVRYGNGTSSNGLQDEIGADSIAKTIFALGDNLKNALDEVRDSINSDPFERNRPERKALIQDFEKRKNQL